MASIQFLSQLTSFKLSNPRKTSSWIKAICAKERRTLDTITYVFCSDEFLSSINKGFLNHSSYTDILSFDLSENDDLAGEIYISVERVRDNARTFNQTFEIELRRVMAHGVLHFIGYKDKTPAEKAQMRSKEDACLSLWK
jgi:probable rRNA maturation factor